MMIKKPSTEGRKESTSRGIPIRHSTVKEYTPIKRSSLPLTERGII